MASKSQENLIKNLSILFLSSYSFVLFIRQVAVLRGDTRGIVLQLGAEPLVTEVATIEAGLVLVESQATQV